ncbi:MAG TPA: hypothetical protein VGF18_04655, partial [Candidatus Tumulicola sp.]
MLAAEAAPPMDPYAIFSQARAAVTAARYPERIDYTIHVSGYDGSVPRANHYLAVDRVDGQDLKVAAISAEEKAAPPTPRGVNVSFDAAICFMLCEVVHIPMGRPVASQDLLGVPMLTPAYAFGLQYPLTRHDRTQLDPSQAGLPVIAVVSTQAREYDIAFMGSQTIDGTDSYGLRLTPRRNPKSNRLRELWVGAVDHLPRRATVAGNFTVAPLTDVPWTIDFTVIDGAPYIRDERADATLFMP